jgi:hypothetical protein
MSRWKNRLVGGGMALMAAGAALVGGSVAGVSDAAGTATMAITPATQNVALGADAFTVNVTAADVQDLGAYDITMKFNPNVLEYVSSAEGNYLTGTGRVQSCIGPKRDPHGGTVIENVNINGALHFACNTFGSSAVAAGPSGSGVLGSVTFRPKSAGQSDLTLEGTQAGEPYVIRVPGADIVDVDGCTPTEPCKDNGDYGQTGLANTEGTGLDLTTLNAVVAVYDPSQPTPTGVPPTPTPRAQATVNTQATVRAALGTPERTLTTPVPGSSGGTDGITGPDVGSTGGGVAGTANGGGSARGSSTATAGTLGRGASGAPIAGYGPQPRDHSRWPLAFGGGMLVMGAIALAAGVAGDRRRA